MSKLLKRAIKVSIAPAILLIAGKLLGIITLSAIYDFDLRLDNDIVNFFSVQLIYPEEKITLFVNTYSDLTMLLILAIPTLYFILKTAIFQKATDNPRTIAKVANLNIMGWITKKDVTFLKIFIWSAFVWIASSLTILNTIQNDTELWVGIFAGILALICTWGSIKTFDTETAKIYPDKHKYF